MAAHCHLDELAGQCGDHRGRGGRRGVRGGPGRAGRREPAKLAAPAVNWPAGWRQHTGVSQSTVYLTLAELAGLETATDALIRRYVDERPFDDVASRPKDSVPVDIYQIITVPLDQPPESS